MKPVLKLNHLTKHYGGITALKDVSMSFQTGEVHAIVGENGAGKSTLIKTVSGAVSPDAGSIWIDGESFNELSPIESKQKGIEVIYQEFNLIESLSAAENIFLGERYSKIIDFSVIEDKAKALFEPFHIQLNPKAWVRDLSPAQKQIVEIIKAISKQAKIIIMDEPTAPLTNKEVDVLFDIIRQLKAKNKTIIYITHRLEEVFEIADCVSVMRDGEYIDTKPIKDTNRAELIGKMVGRVVKTREENPDHTRKDTAFEAKHISGGMVRNVSFALKKGEILGLFGLVGAGRTELARLLFGVDPLDDGELYINNKETLVTSPGKAMKEGIGLIPEDRKSQGCFLDKPVRWNISIAAAKQVSNGLFTDRSKENSLAKHFIDTLRIKAASLTQAVSDLSGGNQQKIVLAKTLARKADIMIFDEPTRGIDVGAREEIYDLMLDLAKEGVGVLMISSDMEELIHMSNRILVMSEGRLTGTLDQRPFKKETLLELASKHVKDGH